MKKYTYNDVIGAFEVHPLFIKEGVRQAEDLDLSPLFNKELNFRSLNC